MTATRHSLYSVCKKADSTDREYEIHCEVLTTDKNNQALTVLAALKSVGSPYLIGTGASFETDPEALLVSYSGIMPRKYESSRTTWKAVEHYKTRSRTDKKNTEQCRPDKAKISGSFWQEQVAAGYEDLDGVTIQNAAGFDFPLEEVLIDKARGILRIDIEQDYIDLAQLEAFTNCVNASTFFGAPAGTVKMDPPQWEQHFSTDCVPYYTVSYQFRGNPDGWQLQPRNASELDGNGDPPVAQTSGVILAGFHDIDASGDFIYDGSAPLFYDGSGSLDPFRVFESKDFGLLGIPTAL